MALYRAHYLIEGQTLVANPCYIDSIEEEEVMMGLTRSWRTRTPVSNGTEAGCAFSEGMIAFQFACIGRNIVDNPMVEATGYWGIIVRHEQHEALRPCWHICPVQLRGGIGASTAKLIQFAFSRERSPVVEVGAGDGTGMQC